jgi:fucose permease
MITSAATFIRDRFTWLAYLLLAYFAYMQAAIGPLMPFLRDELHLNYTVSAFHLSAFALGTIIAGSTGERIARRLGRGIAFWGGAAGMSLGAVLLTLGRNELVTIASSFVMGFLGSVLLVMIQATLTDRHNGLRQIALTEANIAASASAGLVPLVIGGLERVGVGWRGALYVGIAVLALLGVTYGQEQIPQTPHATHHAAGRKIPRVFWIVWLTVLFGVATEWCVIFWSADFLISVVGLPKVDASSMVSLFFIASLTSRIVGSRLARSIDSMVLLMGALVVTFAGFILFWLTPAAAISVCGLFLLGFGIANVYPLALSIATGLAPSDFASARISMGSGVAAFIAPQVLGWAADHIGIRYAYGLVAVLVVTAFAMILIAYRLITHRGAANVG